jgi:cation diffusion facilitator family transporter
MEAQNREQARVLRWLLAINAVMFVGEGLAALWADSAALLGDALDMLADALVYGVSLYAVGRAASAKIRAATLSGVFQLALGLWVLWEVISRALGGSEPLSWAMIGVGAVALVANVICLKMISQHRDGEVHLRASWLFSRNDVIANIGVIIGGVIVLTTGSHWPDLLIRAAIAVLVAKGGVSILRDAREEMAACC